MRAQAQVHTLLKGLEKIANSANIPMVVAGDLNSMPGSAPHSLMLERHVESSHRDLHMDPLYLFTGSSNTNRLSHSLRLRSAYATAVMSSHRSPELDLLISRLDDKHHEPKYTNITHDFKETLDYIVCSSPELQPTALLELPDLKEMLGEDTNSGLPNSRWPSDHIALMAEFQFDFIMGRDGSGVS
jgi:CCR4-NOT transcription complex subunit 6